MPRVMNIGPSGQSSGGLFRFEEGNGRVVDCWVGNHVIPGFGADCGYHVEIQRLDNQWNPLPNTDTVTEFCKAGPVVNQKNGQPLFHPGLADSADDQTPEIGNEKDMGDAVDVNVKGNCLLSAGRSPDKKAKLSYFINSAIEAGCKETVLAKGFAPDLIGLEAHFCQFNMDKVDAKKEGDGPTCLIIGQAGKPTGPGNVHKYPDSMTGAQTQVAQGPVAVPAAKGGQGQGQVNGALAPAAGAGAGAGVSAGDAPDAAAITTAKLLDIAKTSPKAFKIAKLGSMVSARLAGKEAQEYQGRVGEFNALSAAVTKQLKDEQFLQQLAALHGWTVTGTGTDLTVDFS